MKLLMFGPQGCGKGTIGGMLSEKFGIPLISSGQLLRDLSPEHPRYQEIRNLLENGQLAPQDFVAQLLKERTSKPDCANGFICDGWGRAKIDLVHFDPGFDYGIVLNISTQTTLNRLSNRRTCRSCGKIFNILTVPPKIEGKCDVCGGELYQRSDDTEEAILKRLEIYQKETSEVIEMFRKEGKLLEIDGEPSPEIVFNSVLTALERANDPVKIS